MRIARGKTRMQIHQSSKSKQFHPVKLYKPNWIRNKSRVKLGGRISIKMESWILIVIKTSVVDPDPEVYGSPGSGRVIICIVFGSRSGSFNQQAKEVRKP
jgi:hypothetical protein